MATTTDATRITTPTKTTAFVAALVLAAMGVAGVWSFATTTRYKVLEQAVAAPSYVLTEADIAFLSSSENRAAHDTSALILRKAGMRATELKTRLSLLQAAREQQEMALRLAPADTFGWTRLADLRLLTQNNREGAMDALIMSARAAPYVPNMMLPRAMQMYKLRDTVNADAALMAATWRGAFKADPQGLVRKVRGHPELSSVVIAALQEDPSALKRWQERLKQAGTK